jgi:hypothetical protein
MRSALLLLVAAVSMVTASNAQTFRPLLNVRSFTVQVNPLDGNKLYVGNWSHRMYRSYDGGEEWHLTPTGDIGVQNYLSSIIVSSADTGVILVGGYQYDGIRRSTNGGETFERVLEDPAGPRMWFISEAIAEDPQDPRNIYAVRGTRPMALWKSTDIGATWDSIYAIPETTTYRSCTIAIRPDSSNIIMLGVAKGQILRSVDGGLSFVNAKIDGKDTIREDAEIPKIVFSPRDPRTAYMIVAIGSTINPGLQGGGGVWKSVDGGLNWNRMGYPDTSLWAVEAVDRGDHDEVWIGGFRLELQPKAVPGDSLVARTTDDGATWTEYPNFPWGSSDEGDTIRSAWVYRYHKPTQRMYMAMETGFFVADLATSVTEEPNTGSSLHGNLRLRYDNGILTVHDAAPRPDDRTWSVYDLEARLIASGSIDPSMACPLPALPAGTYLLTWGTEARFRTASGAVTR